MTIPRTVAFSRNSANVFFHILTRCNLKCHHCYINPEQHGQQTLPLEVIQTWLGAFSENSLTKNLIFLGGEPTLHPDLPDAIRFARKLGYGSITVDTNGYLFHNMLEKVNPGEVDIFSFSLDGATRATNDRIRGPGSFEACVGGIQKAVSKGFNTSLIYTVSSANIDELEKMLPLLGKLGIGRFFIQIIGLRGRSASKVAAEASGGQLQKISDVINALVTDPGKGKRKEVDAINRAAFVLLISHFQGFVEDLHEELGQFVLKGRARDPAAVIKLVKPPRSNPHVGIINQMFSGLGIYELMESINWRNCNNDSVKSRLTGYIQTRNRIAHGQKESITKLKVQQLMQFVQLLAEKMDEKCAAKTKKAFGKVPWGP